MSQFKEKLEEARRRQKRYHLAAGIAVPIILLLMAVLVVISRGTRINILPDEAKEQADISVTEGLGFGVSDTVYSLAGNLVVTASAPGFRIAEKTIDKTHLGKVIPLELFELPGRLTIEISGESEHLKKTAWRINGRDAAFSDKLDLELETGRYTISVDNSFFKPKEMELEVKRREQTQLLVALQPVEGRLDISSKPAGAAVFIEENKVGETPLQFDVNGGRYNLRLAAENYSDTVENIEITRDNPQVSRNYQLELKKAKVFLDLKPDGGTLLVNGIKGHQAAQEVLLLDASVEHRLTYMKAGYYPATATVHLAADEEKRLSFHLKTEMGKVELASSPQATVLIGGKAHGESPLSLTLPAIAHEITFRKPGYRSVTKTVRPQGRKVQQVSVVLLTEKQARLQEAPREYTNQAGIKLKLFVIEDEFVMGAPRSEKGQRANEFQRKVKLNKPFYAGLHEVTNGQYAQYKPPKAVGAAGAPVTSVSWQEAAVFCNWLSTREKLRPFYTTTGGQVTGFDLKADGYRLLSEGEWEWLSRKAGKGQQTIFTWGNDTVIPPKVTNVADESAKGQVKFYVPHYNDGYPGIAPVGSFNREPSGLYDMAGNVSEWVHDVYSIVPPSKGTVASNPLGQQRGESHVVKGANWRSGTLTTLRSAFREGLAGGRDDVGFRIGRYLYGGENE
jgi:formylglycine-generating enzyme required for sulfatase activity